MPHSRALRLACSTVVVTVLALAPGPVRAQGTPVSPQVIPIKKCSSPDLPFGHLRPGKGEVTFTLKKDGKPDTSTVGVVSVENFSVGGFRNVLTRQLASCQFDLGKAKISGPVAVTQAARFNDTVIVVEPPTVVAAAPATRAVEPLAIPADSLPLPGTDRRIEEYPRGQSCTHRTPSFSGSASARGADPMQARAQVQAQMASQMEDWNRQYAGSVKIELILGADSRIADAVKVLSFENANATHSLVEELKSCKYSPARSNGVTIPVRIVTALIRTPIRVSN